MGKKLALTAAIFLLNFYLVLTFDFYWNIPTFMCKQHEIDFTDIVSRDGIIQNNNNNFRGENMVILYDPGNFPAVLQNSSSLKYYKRNGGVPQEGNISIHLEQLQEHIDLLIPDRNFSGVAVIDFESWRPIFRQNFGVLQPYKNLSIKIQKESHPLMSDKKVLAEAKRKFEEAAKTFMQESIWLTKELRPNANWGYYAFPYCFNGRSTEEPEQCSSGVQRENNQLQWLFDESDYIYPSVYLSESIPISNRLPMVRGRVKEALRVARRTYKKPKIYVYYRYLFTDTLKYINEGTTLNILNEIKNTGADGVILWGSSNDLNTKEKCEEFQNYFNDTLGPIAVSLQETVYVTYEMET